MQLNVHEKRKMEVIQATPLLPDLGWMVVKYAAGISGRIENSWEHTMFKEAEDPDHIGRVRGMAYDHTQELIYFLLDRNAANDFCVSVCIFIFFFFLKKTRIIIGPSNS